MTDSNVVQSLWKGGRPLSFRGGFASSKENQSCASLAATMQTRTMEREEEKEAPPVLQTPPTNPQLTRKRRPSQTNHESSRNATLAPSGGQPTNDNANAEQCFYLKRTMTVHQERMNAITMLPNATICLYYLLTSDWMVWTGAKHGTAQPAIPTGSSFETTITHALNRLVGADPTTGCIDISNNNNNNTWWIPSRLHALAPLPVLLVAGSILLHVPFSMYYHWFVVALPPGAARVQHWSRRLDQSFMHLASACIAYGTSGSVVYGWINAVFNLDCIYRLLCCSRHNPKNIRLRLLLSIIFYTAPMAVVHHQYGLFCQAWMSIAVSVWLFVQYPLGGWSHSAFHATGCFLLPPLVQAALMVPASAAQWRVVADCAAAAARGG